jgi:hypothetical protein
LARRSQLSNTFATDALAPTEDGDTAAFTIAGPDGLKVQHLLDIMASLTEEDRDTFLMALTSLTHMFQKGLLPEVIAQYASSRSLTALNKPGAQLQSVSPSVGFLLRYPTNMRFPC